MHENFVKEIETYNWFKPQYKILASSIYELVDNHQERLKPFGCTRITQCQMIQIWPGLEEKKILELRNESKKDIFPMALFGFGAIIFPENMTSDIIICPQGVKKYDGKTLLIEL